MKNQSEKSITKTKMVSAKKFNQDSIIGNDRRANVYYGKNYVKFQYWVNINRDLDMKHVKAIMTLMAIYGFLGEIIVVKVKFRGFVEYYIADGQHRLKAAELLNIPYKYSIVDLTSKSKEEVLEFISGLNTSSKGWKLETFLRAFAGLGKSEYKEVLRMSEKHKIKLTNVLDLYTASKMDYKGVKKGSLRLIKSSVAEKRAKQITELSAYLTTESFVRRAVVACIKMQNYKHKKMIDKLESLRKDGIVLSKKETELKEQLKKIVENLSNDK